MDPFEPIQKRIDELSDAYEFSGVVVIADATNVKFQATCGFASLPFQIPNQIDTRFRVGSITKMFTAVATLQLVDAGTLNLDTKLHEVLDLSASQIPQAVTIEHLLTMTSGIADWFDESGDWEAAWNKILENHPIYFLRRNQDYLPLFLSLPPESPPGATHKYNGAGYLLLGLVIETLTGQDYEKYVSEQVFSRAGMTSSGFFALDGVDPEVAEGYIPITDSDGNFRSWKKNIYTTTPTGVADGGSYATAADLIRFAQHLRSGDLLSPISTSAMLSPKVSQFDKPFRGYQWMYGYGNIFLLDLEGRIVRYGHTGEEDGASSRLYHYPDSDTTVVILANQSWCTRDLGWEIHDLLTETYES